MVPAEWYERDILVIHAFLSWITWLEIGWPEAWLVLLKVYRIVRNTAACGTVDVYEKKTLSFPIV